MAKIKRIVVAGPLVKESVYPAVAPRDSIAVRQGKKNLSTQAQQRINFKYAWQKLEFLIAANFGKGDAIACLTYDDAHLPSCRKEAVRRVQAFIRKMRAFRGESAGGMKYIYCTEHKHGDGRWHHHIIISATGDDYDAIVRAWPHGYVNLHTMRISRDETYESIAKYLCKEPRDKVGSRLWSGSRNLSKPEVDSFRVPNDTPLAPPEGVLVLDDSGDVRTAYGHYRYIKYMAGKPDNHIRQKAKRRKKRGRF